MPADLTIQILPAAALSPPLQAAVYNLCARAYPGENLDPLWAAYAADFHAIGWTQDLPVSYAMVVTRWLQAGEGPLLRTAYVELAATLPEFQGRGYATALMQRLAAAIAAAGYDLAALCPADTQLYQHLGWEYWRGPLFIRRPPDGWPAGAWPANRVTDRDTDTAADTSAAAELLPTPEERVMILRLPPTPPLNLDLPLSAEWRPGGELW